MSVKASGLCRIEYEAPLISRMSWMGSVGIADTCTFNRRVIGIVTREFPISLHNIKIAIEASQRLRELWLLSELRYMNIIGAL